MCLCWIYAGWVARRASAMAQGAMLQQGVPAKAFTRHFLEEAQHAQKASPAALARLVLRIRDGSDPDIRQAMEHLLGVVRASRVGSEQRRVAVQVAQMLAAGSHVSLEALLVPLAEDGAWEEVGTLLPMSAPSAGASGGGVRALAHALGRRFEHAYVSSCGDRKRAEKWGWM